MIESNLYIIVACMPSFHALVHKAFSTASGGYNNSAKNSYFSNSNRRLKSGGSLPFGVISNSTDVKVYSREESNGTSRGSNSDMELVLRLDRV
jgi:hypothetical protein